MADRVVPAAHIVSSFHTASVAYVVINSIILMLMNVPGFLDALTGLHGLDL